MTPLDQTLVDQMHDKLKVEPAPIVARYHLGGTVVAAFHNDKLVLTIERDEFGPFQIITLTAEEFTNLQKYSEESGWQCD